MATPERVIPGTVLDGRYEIERFVSEGGMGAIYYAHDRQSGAPVAVKLIRAAPGDAGGGDPGSDGERFEREARLLSELSHPSIVSYIAHGRTATGTRFLIMEWLVGEDLASRLRRGPLGVADSLLLMQKLCAGLAAAHARGIMHRDIKPANVTPQRSPPCVVP